MCHEVDSLHKTKLRFVRYTGEPENIKEIEDLVSSWDFKYIVRRETATSSFSLFFLFFL
jgi:hypothetical protein